MERICIILLTIITFMLRYGNVTAEHKIIYPLLNQQSVKENEPKVKEDIKKLTKEIIALKEEISLKNYENIEIVTEKTKMNRVRRLK